RRGNAIATVTAFGSADSHDEHYFTHPDDMIRGRVDDPRLTLGNPDIAERHITAYLLQRYHNERITGTTDRERQRKLFEVLGTVRDFSDAESVLNRADFEAFLRAYEPVLREEIDAWLPMEIEGGARTALLEDFVSRTLVAIDWATAATFAAGNGDA